MLLIPIKFPAVLKLLLNLLSLFLPPSVVAAEDTPKRQVVVITRRL
jgi:hypothetical protein